METKVVQNLSFYHRTFDFVCETVLCSSGYYNLSMTSYFDLKGLISVFNCLIENENIFLRTFDISIDESDDQYFFTPDDFCLFYCDINKVIEKHKHHLKVLMLSPMRTNCLEETFFKISLSNVNVVDFIFHKYSDYNPNEQMKSDWDVLFGNNKLEEIKLTFYESCNNSVAEEISKSIVNAKNGNENLKLEINFYGDIMKQGNIYEKVANTFLSNIYMLKRKFKSLHLNLPFGDTEIVDINLILNLPIENVEILFDILQSFKPCSHINNEPNNYMKKLTLQGINTQKDEEMIWFFRNFGNLKQIKEVSIEGFYDCNSEVLDTFVKSINGKILNFLYLGSTKKNTFDERFLDCLKLNKLKVVRLQVPKSTLDDKKIIGKIIKANPNYLCSVKVKRNITKGLNTLFDRNKLFLQRVYSAAFFLLCFSRFKERESNDCHLKMLNIDILKLIAKIIYEF